MATDPAVIQRLHDQLLMLSRQYDASRIPTPGVDDPRGDPQIALERDRVQNLYLRAISNTMDTPMIAQTVDAAVSLLEQVKKTGPIQEKTVTPFRTTLPVYSMKKFVKPAAITAGITSGVVLLALL